MKIAELLNDEALRKAEFPVCRERIFMAHAAVCAMPSRVAAAMNDCIIAGTTDDQESLLGELLYRTRESAGKILNASVREVALVGPTSLALSYVAAGLDFQAGDNVVCYFEDYPSNVYPWLALRDKGVEVRFIKTGSLGKIEPDDVMAQVDGRTRLVALASCHFITGWRIDVDTIGRALKERGVLFCLDAIQTVGAFPTTVENVDFLAADAHKWMLGPCSAGIFYVSQELQDQLKPMVFGWHNVECPDFVSADRIELKKDARRYEAGTHNIAGTAGLKAAFDLLLEVGIENIAAELRRKRGYIIPRLQTEGWDVINHDAPETNQGGMYSLTKEGVNLPALHQCLAGEKITVSLRTDRAGSHYLRLSPHFYNTDAELDTVLERMITG
jgi:cysteine desulfurase / selenocysteine lyase